MALTAMCCITLKQVSIIISCYFFDLWSTVYSFIQYHIAQFKQLSSYSTAQYSIVQSVPSIDQNIVQCTKYSSAQAGQCSVQWGYSLTRALPAGACRTAPVRTGIHHVRVQGGKTAVLLKSVYPLKSQGGIGNLQQQIISSTCRHEVYFHRLHGLLDTQFIHVKGLSIFVKHLLIHMHHITRILSQIMG